MSQIKSFNSFYNHLEITIQKNEISYTIFDENKKILLRQTMNVSINNTPNQLIDFIFNQPPIQSFDGDIILIFENSFYTLFPHDLFRVEDYQTIFELEHGKIEKASYMSELIENWGVYFVFRISEKIKSFLQKKNPQIEIKHRVAELLNQKVDRKDGVYVLFSKYFTTIIVVKNKELQLTTSFETTTAEDASFFVLSTYEQLKLDKEKDCLNIINVEQQSKELKSILKSYISEIEIIK